MPGICNMQRVSGSHPALAGAIVAVVTQERPGHHSRLVHRLAQPAANATAWQRLL